ncbi:MAG: hypothetical protein MK212_12735 [Saprospiraceae bacterium]|nr:hypothetical protein [Saprospiraceae bacterium]
MTYTPSIQYADGNGNIYHIHADHFIYDPVIPTHSSSGRYSGGTAITKYIQLDQYNQILTIVQEAISDTTQHASSRMKGTGWIRIENSQECILSYNSEIKEGLETILQKLRSN